MVIEQNADAHVPQTNGGLQQFWIRAKVPEYHGFPRRLPFCCSSKIKSTEKKKGRWNELILFDVIFPVISYLQSLEISVVRKFYVFVHGIHFPNYFTFYFSREPADNSESTHFSPCGRHFFIPWFKPFSAVEVLHWQEHRKLNGCEQWFVAPRDMTFCF